MIIIGYQKTPKLLGCVDQFECPECLNFTNWQLVNIENYFTLFFIPIIPTGNVHSIICEICNHEEILSKNDFRNYKIKSDIELSFTNCEITISEKESKIEEINLIIDKDKENRRNAAIEGSKEWQELASKKTDEELLKIYFQERTKYNPSMLNAVKAEIDKRKLTGN